jgi:hypothetical protein
MPQIADIFTTLTGSLAGQGVVAASYAALPDDEAMLTYQSITALQREVDKQAAFCAADLARRSDPALGQSGLALRQGHVNPEAMVQFLGGGSRAGSKRLVEVGTMMAQSEAARDLEKHNEAHPELAVPVSVPWHAPLGDAVTAGVLGLETGNSIRRGLGEPALGVSPGLLCQALIELIEQCRTLNADQAFTAARHTRDLIDADGIAARAEAKTARQYLRGYFKPDGMFHLNAELNPENGAFVKDILDQATGPKMGGPRFVDTRKKAWAQRLLDDPRSPDRIATDVLIELLRIAVNADPGTVFGGSRPTVKVIVQQGTLETRTGHGFLEGRPDPIPLKTVDVDLCTGYTPIGFDDDGQCVNVGRDRRLFTDRQRQGMAVRDGGCLWPGCDRPPSWTEAHHIDDWFAKKGLTNVEDGCLLCRLHHLLLHNQGWVIQRRGPAEYWLVPPPGSGPDKKPIRLHSKSPLHLGSPVQPKATGPTDQAEQQEQPEQQEQQEQQQLPDEGGRAAG